MPDYKTFHEAGFLTSLLDFMSSEKAGVVGDAWKGIKELFNGHSLYTKDQIINTNIAKSSSSLTAVFPVIISKTIDIEHAVMISKAIERKAASMLQMLFAAHQISNVSSAKAYLNKFHKNIDSSIDWSDMDIDDVINYTATTQEEYELPASVKTQMQAVCEHVAKNIHYVLETQLTNRPISEIKIKRSPLNEIQFGGPKQEVSFETQRQVLNPDTNTWDRFRGKEPEWNLIPDDQKREQEVEKMTKSQIKGPLEPNDLRGIASYYGGQVLQNDIRKANEAQPTMMIVNFTYNKEGTSDHINSSCVVGVKALLHYVDSEDIVNRVILKQSDNRGLFNLIRATTGEIAFFKDFIFAVKRAKIDAVAKAGKGSTDKIWKLLELRADRLRGAKVSRMDQANNAAITTLVISKAEVDHIKQYHRIDLNKVGPAKGILRGYNLMALAILDTINEKVDFLYDDGSSMFETLSFGSLEREESGSMYKKVINLVANKR